jgi:hypothetical protein
MPSAGRHHQRQHPLDDQRLQRWRAGVHPVADRGRLGRSATTSAGPGRTAPGAPAAASTMQGVACHEYGPRARPGPLDRGRRDDVPLDHGHWRGCSARSRPTTSPACSSSTASSPPPSRRSTASRSAAAR